MGCMAFLVLLQILFSTLTKRDMKMGIITLAIYGYEFVCVASLHEKFQIQERELPTVAFSINELRNKMLL